jgi:hypothetical protein
MTTSLWTTTCEVRRPFGNADAVATDVPCRLVPDLACGQHGGGLAWTHYVDLPDDTHVRDGCTRTDRTDSVTFDDGDELRIPSGSEVRYVVVWVETHNLGGPMTFRRAYLIRHDAAWE